MPIHFACTCGRRLHAPDDAAGRRARCPKCAAILTVPPSSTDFDLAGALAGAPSEPDLYDLSAPTVSAADLQTPHQTLTAASMEPSLPVLRQRPSLAHRLRQYLYLMLLIGLAPLAFSVLYPHADLRARLTQTLSAHPEAADQFAKLEAAAESNGKGLSVDDLLNVLPNHQLDSALLPRGSHLQWLMAMVAGGLYFGAILFFFPVARHFAKALLLTALFTATVGVLMLLAFQWIAFHTYGVNFGGLNAITLFLFIAKFIGFSYRCAMDPSNGFAISFFGFTFGVGLCEELTKALPLLAAIRRNDDPPGWNELLVRGLASGIGFGIAEAILYAGQYNGIQGVDTYLVRFFSCVLLHALWAAAVAITLFNRQDWLHNTESLWSYSLMLIPILIIPMTLHGLYDTLLKQEHEGYALAVALASFLYLVLQIERMRRRDPDVALAT